MKIQSARPDKLEFSDVFLKPTRISSISSRDEVSEKSSLIPGVLDLDVPIIASPMVDVVDHHVACSIREAGGWAILPRFSQEEDQAESYLLSPRETGCAIGLNDIKRFDYLSQRGCFIFCIDVANAANHNLLSYCDELLSRANKQTYFLLGNIGSVEVYRYLSMYYQDVDNIFAFRCGIAGGAGCTTKNATGVLSPMASMLMDIQDHRQEQVKNERKKTTRVIADGGIKEPADFCKAIAMGADAIMVGSILAACKDSPAASHNYYEGGRVYKVYRGSASADIQKKYKEVPKYIEGTTRDLEEDPRTIKELIKDYSEGLRSSMSYFNARNLDEFQKSCHIAY